MNRKVVGLAASAAILVLAGCGSTSTASNTSPTPSAQASGSPVAEASAVPTTTDPCQLVTQSEASQLAGTSYNAGMEDTTSGGGKICWYGAQTVNVFEVLVATASSAAAAQAQWDSEKSQVSAALQKASSAPGVTVNINVTDTSLSGADRAAVGTFSESGSGHTIAATALYVLKGPVFLAIVDLLVDHAPPTTTAMESEGQTALGRLP
jgi:hypothetical protein